MQSPSTPLDIDEQRRELRRAARGLTPQPRVFDLIAYLARHRERVVPKEELLEKLWPCVIVTDASLQRAASLARTACAKLGAPGAIRTYSRKGYRFMLGEGEAVLTAGTDPLTAKAIPVLRKARAAYDAADWERAVTLFAAVESEHGLETDDLERWAYAAQCAGWKPACALRFERASAAYYSRGDTLRAGWIAVLLSQIHLDNRDSLAARGWLHRATRLLADAPDSREQGYLDYLQSRLGLATDELEPALAAARRAHQAGRRHRDPDLEFLGLLFTGEVMVTLGQIAEGVALLDEAGVAVRSSSISPYAGSLIYCGVITISMTRADWERAGRWAEHFSGWCREHGPHALPGLCTLHRAEVLHVRGALAEAHHEGEKARAMLALRSPWAEGDAWRLLGDVHLERGDTAAAELAYRRAHEHGGETLPGSARLELERGNIRQALRLIHRALAAPTWSVCMRRGLLLAHCAIIACRAGHRNHARAALAELTARPALWSTSALRALVTLARGELATLEGDRTQAMALIRSAIHQWQVILSPVLAAQARCRLAALLVAEGDAPAAATELSLAAAAFERAGADGPLIRCRELGAKIDPATARARKLRVRPALQATS